MLARLLVLSYIVWIHIVAKKIIRCSRKATGVHLLDRKIGSGREEKRKGGFVPRGWWLLPVLPVAHLLRETPLYSVLGILAAVIRSKSDLNPSVRVDDRSVSPSVLKEKNKKVQRKL